MMNKAMSDVAYDLMHKKKKPVPFPKLWSEVCQLKGFNELQEEENIAQFYSDLSIDERFVCIGKNEWDLRMRHTFDEVIIDPEEILVDVSDENEDSEPPNHEEEA